MKEINSAEILFTNRKNNDVNAEFKEITEKQFERLKLFHAQGNPWHSHTASVVSARGRLDILKWLVDNGCPCNGWACYYAAKNAEWTTVKWIHDNNLCNCNKHHNFEDGIEFFKHEE